MEEQRQIKLLSDAPPLKIQTAVSNTPEDATPLGLSAVETPGLTPGAEDPDDLELISKQIEQYQ